MILDPSARWGCSFRGLVTDQQTPDYESRASCKRPGLGAAFVGLALALCLLPSTLAAQGRAGEALATRYATRFRCDTATTLEATRHPDTEEPPGIGQGVCWVLASLGVPTREQRVEVEGLESLYWHYLDPDGRTLLVVLSRPDPDYGFAVSATSW